MILNNIENANDAGKIEAKKININSKIYCILSFFINVNPHNNDVIIQYGNKIKNTRWNALDETDFCINNTGVIEYNVIPRY